MRFIDSSVFVAGAYEDHLRFAEADAFLKGAIAAGDAITSAHALAETYSVLTRIPKPNRFSPTAAGAYLADLVAGLEVTVLSAREMLRLIDDLGSTALTGGRIYDAIHARTAAVAGAKEIVTFNTKDFDGLEPGVQVESPA